MIFLRISYIPTACQFPQLLQIGAKLRQERLIQVIVIVTVVEEPEQQTLKFLRTHSLDFPAEDWEHILVRFQSLSELPGEVV